MRTLIKTNDDLLRRNIQQLSSHKRTRVTFNNPLVSNVWEVSYYTNIEVGYLFYSKSEIQRCVCVLICKMKINFDFDFSHSQYANFLPLDLDVTQLIKK